MSPHEVSGSTGRDRRSELSRLGEAVEEGTDEIVERLLGRARGSRRALDPRVEQDFAGAARVGTVAFARWVAGAGPDEARAVGREAWGIFGRLAAEQAAPLSEATKRCLMWRDSVADVLEAAAARLGSSRAALSEALAMLQRSLDVTLVRMCGSFEDERERIHEELAERQRELAFQATHDALTGLPNRALILERVEQMLSRSRRALLPIAALFIDLDNFKGINDMLGHSVGDRLLRAVAGRLEAVLREGDTLGRLGGDEFVVLAEGLSVIAAPELIAERLLGVLREPFTFEGVTDTALSVTASLGIAVGGRASGEELLRDADIAMYRAKAAGKNCFVLFEPAMQLAAQHRMKLEMELHAALQGDQFFLEYQPTFELRDMRATGAEALLRWNHPELGVIGPSEFIPVLEETGMIVHVGRWVLERACELATSWHQAGRRIAIAVNVSGRQLDHDAIVDDIQEALKLSGLDPNALIIEVTESVLMRGAPGTSRRLAAIKDLGVRLAVDDFGTGYSSLAHLRRIPVDALKIDRSFVAGMLGSPEGETLVRTLVQLGRSLGIDVLAEGIEETPQLDLLKQERCESGQGYLFAAPLGAAEIGPFFDSWSSGVASIDEVEGRWSTLWPSAVAE
ncbi:MAG TPA: EAL domain-containing protein [Acidimicrobiales bacterium]|nr:EAL domain-containing protein [Acidimicrobiales bacterium]